MHYPKAYSSNNFQIQNWGTFDVSNYGDLIFPLILDFEIKKRIPEIDITLYSPQGCEFEPEPNRCVKRITRIEEEGFINNILNYKGIVLGGGDIIRFDDSAMVSVYGISQQQAEQERSYRVFIEDLGKLSSLIPVMWNSVGIPFDFDDQQAFLLRKNLEKISYISVRDDLSKKKLIDAGLEKEIYVVPDTAFLVARYYPKSNLADIHRVLIEKNEFPGYGKVLCFQVTYDAIRYLKELVIAISKLIEIEPDIEIVFLPIGLYNNDQLILKKLQEEIPKKTFLVDGNIDTRKVAAVIAYSDYFAGTSLHGNVTAYAYGVPHLFMNFFNLEKIKGNAIIMESEQSVINEFSMLETSLLKLIKQHKDWDRPLSKLIKKIDAHFDNIAEKLQKSQNIVLPIDEAIKYFDDVSKELRVFIVEREIKKSQKYIEELNFQAQEIKCQLERSQSQHQQTQVELERSQSHLQQTQIELERSQSDLQQTQMELERSQCTIAAIDTSKFWQMRKIWFKFRHAVGLLDDDNPFHVSLWLKFRGATTINLVPDSSSSHITVLSQLKNLWSLLRTKGLWYCVNKLRKKTSSKLKFDDALLPTIALPDIPETSDINYQKWLNQNYPNQPALQKMGKTAKLLAYKPTISLIMPVFNTPICFLREAIESVLNQVYPYWELCIADDYSTDNSLRQILEDYSSKDSRIKVVFRTENGHISRCSNSAIEIATGEFIALLDHDDLLTPDALYEIAQLLNKHPEADMIYSDEDKIDENGKLRDPFFKPDWCPDSFLSRMYTCHLGTYRRELVNTIGGFRTGYEGSQDYDLVLRLTEKTTQIYHIPKILYHWRIHPQSAASKPDQKPYAVIAAEKALVDALARRGEHGQVTQAESLVGHCIIRYTIKDYKLVSIIIPTRDLGNILDKCLTSIFEKTTYPNYEVILIDNGSQEENTANVISKWQKKEPSRFQCYQLDIPFNYSKINNYAVTHAKGDYLLFLNNDIEVITHDWIDAMVEQAQRPSIGTVGALLLYPDNTIQHAGVVMGIGGVAGHSHKHYLADSPGYFDQILTVNNYSAVTAACLMCRQEIFKSVGGFEEELTVAFNDIDLCLKIVAKGYRNIYLPHVKLYHYESKSRGYEDTPAKLARFLKETEYMQNKWEKFIEYDPCYSINLTSKHEDYRIRI